jgi:hypothetical protein
VQEIDPVYGWATTSYTALIQVEPNHFLIAYDTGWKKAQFNQVYMVDMWIERE